MRRKVLALIVLLTMSINVCSCSFIKETPAENSAAYETKKEEGNTASVSTEVSEEDELGYSYGYNVTFRSKEPVTYTMLFSDASWYPLVDTWKTEGVFKKIEEITNVHLDITSIDSTYYMDKALSIVKNGDAPYIIPKVYYETDFVPTKEIVAISDWIGYMPNYSRFVQNYYLTDDLKQIRQADGKYYRLPGLKEEALQDYSFLVRTDYFEGAGIDVMELQRTWTWEDLYDALLKVKAYMVKEGIITMEDYVWDDLWCGSDSGQNNGGNLMQLMGASYDVPLGWAVNNGYSYDEETGEFYFASAGEGYKKTLEIAKKLINSKILNPATFTHPDQDAQDYFNSGKGAIISVNRSQYTSWMEALRKEQGEDVKADLVMLPMGDNNYTAENTRLECGLLITKNAYDDLGVEGFEKMLRFVDWLWFSSEGQKLCKWGVEGETYETVIDENGEKKIVLLPEYYCGGLSIPKTSDDQVDMRFKYGYACGNFMMNNGNREMQTDHFPDEFKRLYDDYSEYRSLKPLLPGYTLSEEDKARYNGLRDPLIENVNNWTMDFLLGKKDISTDYEAYVESCKALGMDEYIDLLNSGIKR